ncbi:VOC family protein [Streptomyces sp. SID8379]|uniref:VOC family protein n=1 Tax=unclassified Streptomyces TaxID=2593676 RepID=UPI000475BEF1|nr:MULTISPECIES: VOC family protein [unclassified Streptomyces]MYW62777.1 VOC family protein [Streptomyces sp. SID8379]
MITTDFVNGAPNWLDLGTPDLDGAIAFYDGLFGWTFRSAGPEYGGYGTFHLDGKAVAGGMTVTADQGSPAWSIYFKTADADATAKAVEQAGGTAHLQPMDVGDLGRMAILADPAGATFGIWQPGVHRGLEHVTEDGGLNWVELYVPDPAAAKEFYGTVLGWGAFDVEFPGGTYTTVNPADTDENAMFGGIVPLDADPVEARAGAHWTPYIHVADVDAVADRTQELGGTVRLAPVNIPGVGRIAKLADPSGAGFAVLRGDPNQQ